MRRMLFVLSVALALTIGVQAEPLFNQLSATQTAGTLEFPRHTKNVAIISDGSDTCYFRLFTDADTFVEAEANPTGAGEEIPVQNNDQFIIAFFPQTLTGGAAQRDSESFANGQRATYYRYLSYICAAGETATWRVISK